MLPYSKKELVLKQVYGDAYSESESTNQLNPIIDIWATRYVLGRDANVEKIIHWNLALQVETMYTYQSYTFSIKFIGSVIGYKMPKDTTS